LNRASGWGAHRAGRVEVSETHTLFCQCVDPRCFDEIVAIAPNVFPSQIINENQDDIWTLFGVKNIAAADKSCQDEKKSKGSHVFVAR
jgi:hypothetical protein